jgi:hypothetical protein
MDDQWRSQHYIVFSFLWAFDRVVHQLRWKNLQFCTIHGLTWLAASNLHCKWGTRTQTSGSSAGGCSSCSRQILDDASDSDFEPRDLDTLWNTLSVDKQSLKYLYSLSPLALPCQRSYYATSSSLSPLPARIDEEAQTCMLKVWGCIFHLLTIWLTFASVIVAQQMPQL